MNILALCTISMSEINVGYSDITYDWIEKNPNPFNDLLYSLGMETSKGFEMQEAVQHRNRLNKVVTCTRWIGNERTDEAWVRSGYASLSAIDKAKGNVLLIDLYRERGQVE